MHITNLSTCTLVYSSHFKNLRLIYSCRDLDILIIQNNSGFMDKLFFLDILLSDSRRKDSYHEILNSY